MTTTDATPATDDALANARDTHLWVERVGERRYVGHNSRGARVEVGDIKYDGAFSPGELLKIALAGCGAMSAERALSRRLGDDMAVTLHVGGLADPDENRYSALAEKLVVDLSSLPPDEREKLLVIVRRTVEQHCTVARTLAAGATTSLTIEA